MTYYVYVLACEDGSFYTGYTKNINLRVKQHKKGHGARYTRMHEPRNLIYVEEFQNRNDAMKREREIKSLSHNEKERLREQSHTLYGHEGH